jgi:hypothetical protein
MDFVCSGHIRIAFGVAQGSTLPLHPPFPTPKKLTGASHHRKPSMLTD